MKMYYYVCLCVVICLLYLLLRHKLSYWRRRGVPSLPISLISTELKWMVMNKSRFECFKEIYDQLAPHKYGGYNVMPLKMMIRDPEIIKFVLTKEFESFSSREKLFFTKSDPLTHFIFNLDGKEWKDTRARLTPGFSSSRLKHMFNLIGECAHEMDKSLQIAEDGQVVDVCKILRLYVLNVIFTCTFGMKVNSMKNGCDIFLKMSNFIRGDSEISKKLANFSFIFPSAIRHYIRSSIYEASSRDFFKDIILESIKYREDNNINRNDFLQIFISLMKEGDEECRWTLDKTLAHGILYILAGLSNTTNSISFLLYEMSRNPEMQQKLHEEIDAIINEFGEELNYEAISKTNYLNKVISETMRKYCIVPTFSRRCTNTCALPDGFVVEKGTLLVLSISGLHHDPLYYPDPLKFDPERFNEENKNTRHPYCFLPFGAGPRYCIGERFSMLMMKAAVFTILRKFSVSVLPEHEIGFEFLPNKLTTEVQSINLQFTRRSQSEKVQ